MMKRFLAGLLALTILCGSGLAAAEPSNEMSLKEKQEMLTFSVGSALMLVEVCDADIIRVQHFPGGKAVEETRGTTPNTFTVDYGTGFNEYQVTEADGILTITTARLKVTVDKSTGKVTYYDAAGNLILAEQDRSAKPITLDDQTTSYEVAQEFVSDDNEALYGFGNINSIMGIKGETISLAQLNTEKRTPMFYSNMGYGILFDITSNGQLDWLDENSVYRYTGYASDSMDYFFFYGPDADTVISGYRTVTGRATMLPKNAFGYVQSRNRYTSQAELQNTLDTFREKKIPLDGLVIDYYWWQGGFGDITHWASGWTNPVQMMEYLHNNHVSCSISVWPSFDKGTDAYNRMDAVNGILHSDTRFGGYFYDPSSPAARDEYWSMINEYIFSKGLDSIWLDACEPEFTNWPSNTASEQLYVGNSKPVGLMYPLLTNLGIYEHQRAIEGNTKRVNSLSRGAVAGLQRYGAQSWSGDIASSWEQLTAEVAGLANFSAAGLPYFGTDIGGYWGFNNADPNAREMYLRWLQLGTFMTIMRSHGTENPREPWQFGSMYEGYITEYIYLRERLIPYLYSLAGAVTQEDYTIVRPLIFDFRTDNNVKHISDQFMFGPALMVAPVTSLGQRSRDVYLPEGTWTNFWTGESIISAGETVQVNAPLNQIPLFVRGGSIVPMGPENQYVDESQDPTEIRVYMGADGSFDLYEDEGDGYDYEKGEFSNIPFTYNEETKTLTIGKREGSFDGMLESRTFKVVFVQSGYGIGGDISSDYQPSAVVAYDGNEASVTFDPEWEIPTPPLDLGSLPAPPTAPSAKASDRAMVGYWPFDEGEGGKVADESGSFNTGGLNLSHWTTDSKAGNAIQFSGGDAGIDGTRVEVPDSVSLDLTDQIAFSAWIKNDSTGHANIVNKGGNGTDNPGYSFILYDGTKLQLELQSALDGNNQSQKATAKSTVSVERDGQWHQVGFSWQSTAAGGDGIIRIYMDGRQVTDDSDTANYFAGPIGVNTYPLVLGRSCENEPTYPNYFKGVMDEVRLFNYALTGEEMEALNAFENIFSDNVTGAAAVPGDGSLTVTWTDADTTAQVQVTVESAQPEYSVVPMSKTVTVPAGQQSLTVDGLTNGEYYFVVLVSVEEDGSAASGVGLVAQPAPYPAAVDEFYTVTHGEQIYAWIENFSSAAISGTLTVTLRENGEEKEKLTQELTVEGGEPLRYTGILKTAYVTGQTVTFRFTGKDGHLLAAETTVDRTPLYTERIGADKNQLENHLQYTVDESLYTPETYAAYQEALRLARIVERNPKATQEEVDNAVKNLTQARRNLKRLASDGIVMRFSKSEGVKSELLYGTMFYIDWQAADGVPDSKQSGLGVNLAGEADNGADNNMHLKATVQFATTDGSDPAHVWSELRFRLRSSYIGGEERASGFVTLHPSDVSTPDGFEVDIPLSAFTAEGIDWSDVKELIIQCDANSAYHNKTIASMTLTDIWIEDTTKAIEPPPVDENTNLILGKTITTDATGYYGTMGEINDGDPNTFWDSLIENLPTQLTVDLGWQYTLSRIEMLLPAGWATDRHQEMEIQISEDGRTYTPAVAKTSYLFSQSQNNNTVTVTLPQDTTGRYLRIVGYSNDESFAPGMQLGELRAFGRYSDDDDDPKPGDRTALNAVIAEAEAIDRSQYTDESVGVLEQALEAAKALADDADQAAVDAAEQALKTAIAGLEPIENDKFMLGDVDGDGTVKASDALLALQAATSKIDLLEVQQSAADVDGKAGISSADALLILQYATQKISSF